jgi:two-component system nitrogen regulation sensor histidine kinase NtrY
MREIKLWWRKLSLFKKFVYIAALVLLLVLIILQSFPFQFSETQFAEMPASNLVVFVFINLTIILILVLAFVVGRSIVKLVFERRQELLGSRLRLRLVAVFVSLIAVPTVILFTVAQGLLSDAISEWFSNPVEEAMEASLNIARNEFEYSKVKLESLGFEIQEQLSSYELSSLLKKSGRELLEKLRDNKQLFALLILDTKGRELLSVVHPTANISGFELAKIDPAIAMQAAAGEKPTSITEEVGGSRFIVLYRQLKLSNKNYVLLLMDRLDSDLTSALVKITDAVREYRQAKFHRSPLRIGYLLTLALITGLILFSAIWAGIFLAKQITVPIQNLAESIDQIAKGNYDVQVKTKNRDEIGFLVQRFNQMARDLKRTTTEAERRRLFIETILEQLAVAVISLDREAHLKLVNSSAAKMFNIDVEEARNKTIDQVFSVEIRQILEPLVRKAILLLNNEDKNLGEFEFKFVQGGEERKIVGRCVAIGQNYGVLMLFDDVTAITRAEQVAAWREVARRIAHEIKNPLTPIRLLAQRLKKLQDTNQLSDSSLEQTTSSIVKNVDLIATLVDEFSKFARMPAAEFSDFDLNQVVSEVFASFAASASEVKFEINLDQNIKMITADQKQIKRLLINLIDNAIAALSEAEADSIKLLRLTTTYDQNSNNVIIELADTGKGVPDSEKGKIFEPYVTFKKDGSGTGLGLAIVQNIVGEHGGTIRVFDNQPSGARFVVSLPVAR